MRADQGSFAASNQTGEALVSQASAACCKLGACLLGMPRATACLSSSPLFTPAAVSPFSTPNRREAKVRNEIFGGFALLRQLPARPFIPPKWFRDIFVEVPGVDG